MLYFLLYLWLTHEYWIPAGFLGDNYEISTHGNIRKYGKEMCQVETQYGYLKIKIQIDKKRKIYQAHRVICEGFYGKSDLHVNHIDGNKQNNWVCNLEYCTRSENQIHASRLGLIKSGISDWKSITIYQKSRSGELLNIHGSAGEASRVTGILKCNILFACRKEGRIAGGFQWEQKAIS